MSVRIFVDDSLVIDGDVEHEFMLRAETQYLALSDGTLVKVDFDDYEDKYILSVVKGDTDYYIEENLLSDDAEEIALIVDGSIEWAVLGELNE
jgi:hypothetical protein